MSPVQSVRCTDTLGRGMTLWGLARPHGLAVESHLLIPTSVFQVFCYHDRAGPVRAATSC